jgi:hypothetical protein
MEHLIVPFIPHRQYASALSRVLKRQQFKTLEVFYVVKEELVNISSNLSKTDRSILDKALAEFEFSGRTTKRI